jgi:hypothetical protein
MKINPKLRQDLIKYNLNFPVDARTKEYKAEVAKYRAPELYKLALQSKVATAKIIQRDIDRKEKKEANKKARAEAKKLKHYIGSITIKIRILYKKKLKSGLPYIEDVFRTIPVDIKSTNIKTDLNDIVIEHNINGSKNNHSIKVVTEDQSYIRANLFRSTFVEQC